MLARGLEWEVEMKDVGEGRGLGDRLGMLDVNRLIYFKYSFVVMLGEIC